jgi:hypothetical protein
MGEVGDEVARVAAHESVDLVVLSWSQNASAGRARVVRDVLSRSVIPVLLLPVMPVAASS